MNTSRIYIVIGFLFLFPFVAKAQHKFEREYNIKSEMIPQSAKEFINSIGFDSRIKWYKEISLNGSSIEAKFKHNNKKYSVEFDTLGTLQDVEILIKKTDVNAKTYNIIERKLDSLYQKWKFQKVQIHYSGKSSDIITFLRNNETNSAIKVFYEIILKGKNIEDTQQYEITFNEHGAIENILQIIQDKADHLEY